MECDLRWVSINLVVHNLFITVEILLHETVHVFEIHVACNITYFIQTLYIGQVWYLDEITHIKIPVVGMNKLIYMPPKGTKMYG